MIRTLIFGAIAGYVGKKLYDEGKLTEFKDDMVSRYQHIRDDMSAHWAQSSSANDRGSPSITPTPPRTTVPGAAISS